MAANSNAAANSDLDAGLSVRSRLFADDDIEQHDNNNNNHHISSLSHHAYNKHSSVLKPFDLNREFTESGDHPFSNNGDNDNDNDNNNNGNARAGSLRPPESPPSRLRNTSIPSTLTPFRPRRDRQPTVALRKRHAEQDDLYGNDWSCVAINDSSEAFPAIESPVDMYTSPRISPSTPTRGSSGTGNNGNAIVNRMATSHRSPFYSKQHQQRQQQGGRQQQLQYHKSPSHFQTLDGRTVQSKNPFSPMVFDETPTPTPSKPLPMGNSPAPGKGGQASALGLTHPLLFPVGSLSGEDTTNGEKSHLVLRHKLQKRGSSPGTNSPKGPSINSPMNSLGMDMDVLTRGGRLSSGEGKNTPTINTKEGHQLEEKVSMYIRDGYPEQTGQYSFTGSPIKENFATTTIARSPVNNESSSKSLLSHFDKQSLPSDKETQKAPKQQDFCTNIHKIRRRSKGDDVGAAAAQGESTWKKNGLYINTNNIDGTDNDNNASLIKDNNESGFHSHPENKFYYNKHNQQQISKNPNDDGISPTDVFNYPQFRASPSDTSTLPPTPSKPVRRPPIRRYTPIRKTTGPPPTPTPGARQPLTFDFNLNSTNNRTFDGVNNNGEDSSDDEDANDPISNANRRRRRRRPLSGSDTDARGNAALLPSRFLSDFDVMSELGSGSFGKVFKVLSRLDGCFYAIKVAHRVAKGIADRDRMLKEVYALAALSDHADTATFHIVRYHQAWMEEERLYIQTELCTTTLQAEMQDVAPRQLPLQTRYKCLREILLALNFIHNNQMVHLDIKPENIFLKNNQFKLGDFGLVSKVSSHDVEEGDSRYMSMELLSGDHADLTKSDIFSLGIAMYEICLGSSKTLPSNGPEWQTLRSGSIKPPPNTDDELFQIIKKMMNPTYQERPCASDLLKMPELLSEDQKMMVREREKLLHASQALAARPFQSIPKPKGLVRRNTWSAF